MTYFCELKTAKDDFACIFLSMHHATWARGQSHGFACIGLLLLLVDSRSILSKLVVRPGCIVVLSFFWFISSYSSLLRHRVTMCLFFKLSKPPRCGHSVDCHAFSFLFQEWPLYLCVVFIKFLTFPQILQMRSKTNQFVLLRDGMD